MRVIVQENRGLNSDWIDMHMNVLIQYYIVVPSALARNGPLLLSKSDPGVDHGVRSGSAIEIG